MRDLGELWKKFQDTDTEYWTFQRRIIVDGDMYYDDDIIDVDRENGLFDEDFSIGRCEIGRFDFTVTQRDGKEIAKGAKVQHQIRRIYKSNFQRLTDKNEKTLTTSDNKILTVKRSRRYTEWIDFGTYYVDYAELSGVRVKTVKVECYDAMIFTNQEFASARGTIDDYPMPAKKMLEIISGLINVPLDPRNEISDDVEVTIFSAVMSESDTPAETPPRTPGITIRTILENIAVSHSENFTITDDEKLRLVIAKNDTPLDVLNLNRRMDSTKSEPRQFTKLRMYYNDDGDYYEAGTGDAVLEVLNLFATQKITDNVYKIISEYKYNTFELKDVNILNPALELGDPIEIDGEQCNLWRVRWSPRLFADITAPTKGDLSKNFGSYGTERNADLRRAASMNERFMTLEAGLEGFRVEVGETIYTKNDVDGIIETSEETLRSEIITNIRSISLSVTEVKDGNVVKGSSIQLTADGVNIGSSGVISFDGIVNFINSGLGSGQSTINGGIITTNTITTDQLKIETFKSLSYALSSPLTGNRFVYTDENGIMKTSTVSTFSNGNDIILPYNSGGSLLAQLGTYLSGFYSDHINIGGINSGIRFFSNGVSEGSYMKQTVSTNLSYYQQDDAGRAIVALRNLLIALQSYGLINWNNY